MLIITRAAKTDITTTFTPHRLKMGAWISYNSETKPNYLRIEIKSNHYIDKKEQVSSCDTQDMHHICPINSKTSPLWLILLGLRDKEKKIKVVKH